MVVGDVTNYTTFLVKLFKLLSTAVQFTFVFNSVFRGNIYRSSKEPWPLRSFSLEPLRGLYPPYCFFFF